MKLERLALLMTLGVAGLAGCAADRNKDVKNAESNLASEQLQARSEEARLDQKHAQEQSIAQQSPQMTTNDRAELQQKQIEERADQKEENAKNISDAEKDLTKANANMQNDRAKTDAEVKARIQKADARFWEAKNKSAKVPEGRRVKFNADVNLYKSKKADVEAKNSNLMRASNQEYNNAKQQVDKALDELENFADRIHDNL